MNDLHVLAYKMLVVDEGIRYYPYDDQTGNPIDAIGKVTIGIGHNLDASPLSDDVVKLIFKEDLEIAIVDAMRFVGAYCWNTLSINRKLGLINLAFSLGETKLSNFILLKNAILNNNWTAAGYELRTSRWARQVDQRNLKDSGRDDRVIMLIEKDIYVY